MGPKREQERALTRDVETGASDSDEGHDGKRVSKICYVVLIVVFLMFCAAVGTTVHCCCKGKKDAGDGNNKEIEKAKNPKETRSRCYRDGGMFVQVWFGCVSEKGEVILQGKKRGNEG